MRQRWFGVVLLITVASLAECTGEAFAQSLGTFRWQLQPYCNVLTLTATRNGAIYTLDGFDDQCGAAQRASAVGTAVVNPDGSINLGMVTVLAPSGLPIHIDARIDVGTLGGTWRDSSGGSGTFLFTSGTNGGGIARPAVSTGLFKRSAFAHVTVPPAGTPAVELTSLTLTAPISGVAELRGRGYCSLGAIAGAHNQIAIAGGTSAAVLTSANDSEFGRATVGSSAPITLYQPSWSTETILNVHAGVTYTLGLFAIQDGANATGACTGTFTVQIFAGSQP